MLKKNVEIKIRKHGAPGRFCVLWLRRVVLALGLVAHAFSHNTPETEAGIIPWALGQRVRPCLKRKTKWPPSANFPLNRNLKEAVKETHAIPSGRWQAGGGGWVLDGIALNPPVPRKKMVLHAVSF